MNRRSALSAVPTLVMIATVLAGCAGTPAQGTMQVYVTDAPPNGVTAIDIKASSIEAHRAGADDGEWVSLIKDPPVFDLVKLTGVNLLLGSANISTGNYTQIRLDIVDVTVTLNDKRVKATVPSDKLRLVGNITIEAGKETPVTLDFDAEQSIVVSGNDSVRLKPTVKLLVGKPGGNPEKPPAATSNMTPLLQ